MGNMKQFRTGTIIENEGSQWFTVKLKVRFYQILKLKHTTKHS